MSNSRGKKTSNKSFAPNARVTSAKTGDSYANFEARIGIKAGNLSEGGGYQIDYLSKNRQALDAMYRSSWICGKAIDTVAEDMTKRGIDIQSEIDPGEIDELQRVWKQMRIWNALCDTIKWARLYGGAIAVLLIDGQNWATPLRPNVVLQRGQFKGLMVFDRWQLQPSLQQPIMELGPDLGMPTFYETVGTTRGLGARKIHYSRVIRVDGQDLPYWQSIAENGWGQSVLERLYDRLLAFDSTTQGAAQLVFKAHLRTYKIPGLRDIIAQGGPMLEGLTKQINFIRATQTNEGMTLMDAEDTFEATSYNFSGLDTVLLQFSQQLSGALDIPLTKLFGQSPAGLNSTGEGDENNYDEGINQQQERRLRTGISLLLGLSYQSAFGKTLPPGSDFTFRPLSVLSDEQKADIAVKLTGAITSACTSAVIDRQTALKELRAQSRVTGVWTNISDEAIEAADDDVNVGGELGDGSAAASEEPDVTSEEEDDRAAAA